MNNIYMKFLTLYWAYNPFFICLYRQFIMQTSFFFSFYYCVHKIVKQYILQICCLFHDVACLEFFFIPLS